MEIAAVVILVIVLGIVVRRIARKSNTQVHRINVKRKSSTRVRADHEEVEP